MFPARARHVFGVIAICAITFAATACGSSSSSSSSTSSSSATSTGSTATALKLGVLLPHTGTLAFLEPPMGDSVTLALKDINAAGGVNGKPVTQVGADEGTAQPSIVTQATNTLLQDKVNAIIGAAATGDTLSVIDKITTAPVVECSPSNTGAILTNYARPWLLLPHGSAGRTAVQGARQRDPGSRPFQRRTRWTGHRLRQGIPERPQVGALELRCHGRR